ncbi:hypothetical protein M2318_004872 [Metapseudomonas resinovorans]
MSVMEAQLRLLLDEMQQLREESEGQENPDHDDSPSS